MAVFFVAVRVPTIRAGLRLKGRLPDVHFQSQVRQHAVEDMIVQIANGVRKNFKGYVSIPQVERCPQERLRRAAARRGNCFGRSRDFGHNTVSCYADAMAQDGTAREDDLGLPSVRQGGAEAAARAQLKRKRKHNGR